MAYRKKNIFDHIIDICDLHARPGPAETLFDGLFLSQFRRYELEILKQFEYQVLNCRIKFWIESVVWFR